MRVFLGVTIGMLGVILIIVGFTSRYNELFHALFGFQSPLANGSIKPIPGTGSDGSKVPR